MMNAHRKAMTDYRDNFHHLDALEAESIHIIREAVAEASRPAMLYSRGKDSSVMLRLAKKAFYPGMSSFRSIILSMRCREISRSALCAACGLWGALTAWARFDHRQTP